MKGASKPTVPAPAHLRVANITFDDEEFVVLSYPLPTYRFPRSLTPAEREVAGAFASGETMAAIATRRRASVHTVANQLRAVYRKLGVRSRLELGRRLAGSS